MEQQKILNDLQKNGYSLIDSYYNISESVLVKATSLATDTNYKVGSSYKTEKPNSIDLDLLQLVKNENIKKVRTILPSPDLIFIIFLIKFI